MKDLDLFHQVSLLGVLKKEPHESLEDVKTSLVETGMFDDATATQVFNDLLTRGYLRDTGLTMIGVEAATAAEKMFAKAGEEMSLADR